MNLIKKLSIFFLAVSLLILGYFLFSYQKNIHISANVSESALGASNDISFVLFGQTGRPIGWSMAPDLADTIMVMDYRPKIGVLNIVSLPRDLWVTYDGESFKANEVIRKNMISQFVADVKNITGVETDKYLVVNIDILKKVVDEMGGIDIELKSDAVDWVSGYTLKKGKQHLNGDQAVWLSRNRFSSEGDFFREKNQQDIIKSLISGFRKMGGLDKIKFAFSMMPEIAKLDTNINIQEIMPLVEKFNSARFNNIVMDFESGVFKSAGYQYNPSSTAYILVPSKGQGDYSQVREYIQARMER